jgi:hypothetical protein
MREVNDVPRIGDVSLQRTHVEGAERQLRLGEQEGLAERAVLPRREINARLYG